MNQHIGNISIISVLVLLGAASCVKEGYEGGAIRFGVSTVYENGPSTKTEYSGKDETGGSIKSSSQYERIDWLSSDRICIASPQATLADGSGHKANYTVQPGNRSGKEHSAKIAPEDGNGLQWGSGSHDFYALYPSHGQNGAASLSLNEAGGATVSGNIPTEQKPTQVGRVFKPDMNYAYMYARTTGISAGENVTLEFHPLVTTVEFTLLTKEGEEKISSPLTSVTLSSAQTDANLAGNFSAPLSSEGLGPVTAQTNSPELNTITIPLPDDGVQLGATAEEAYTVTFLLLPLEQKDLTLTLNFANETQRTLALKDGGEFIKLPACRKTYIWKLQAPLSVYTFTVDVSALEASDIKAVGETRSYSVTSYKKTGDARTQIPWEAEFSTDEGASWGSEAPAWVTTFTLSADGSTGATAYPATFHANDGETDKFWKGANTPINSDKSEARDLSRFTIYGEACPQTTANCYVVSAPGWYKIPAVYGNTINGGANNLPPVTGFVDGQGRDISTAGPNISGITGAILCWQDHASLVTDVEASDDGQYIYFHVGKYEMSQGNALIAATDASGTIIWSWHIWAMEFKNDAGEIVLFDPAGGVSFSNLETTAINSNSAAGTIEMMNVNLGWCTHEVFSKKERSCMVRFRQSGSGKVSEVYTITQDSMNAYKSFGNGPYYQWGRKDPMLPSKGNANENKTQSGERLWKTSSAGSGVSFATAASNPNIFYIRAGRWYSGSAARANLWNYDANDKDDKPVRKTVYDPCPPGFKMINKWSATNVKIDNDSATGKKAYTSAAFTREANDNGDVNKTIRYCILKDDQGAKVVFPFSGTRIYYSGSVTYVGSTPYRGDLQSAVYQQSLDFRGETDDVCLLDNCNETNGFAVRPIKDENTGAIPDAYVFTVESPSGLAHSGGTTTGQVVSYKYSKGSDIPANRTQIPWVVEGYYPTEEDALAATNKYSAITDTYLTSFPDSGTGSSTINITYGPGEGTHYVQDLSSEIADRLASNTGAYVKRGSSGSLENYWNLANPQTGSTSSIAESANTYIVNAPGYYCFPLVMGNGIKAGSFNTVAYRQNNFTNYQGTALTGETSTPLLNDQGGTPSSAYIVWEEADMVTRESDWTLPSGCITSSTMSIDGADRTVYWLNFRITDTIKQGCIILAVTDDAGDVMWSWTIWVTDYVPRNYGAYSSSAVLADIECTYDASGNKVTFMPQNLGWVEGGIYKIHYAEMSVFVRLHQSGTDDFAIMELIKQEGIDETGISGHCPYYQWGRKDAFIPSNGKGNTVLSPLYGKTTLHKFTNAQQTLATAIKNPDRQYGYGSSTVKDWCSTSDNGWWCAGNSTPGYEDQPTVKTIYDPCPAGYTIPRRNAFKGFRLGTSGNSPNASSFDNGYYLWTGYRADESVSTAGMKKIFFPVSGHLHQTSGKLDAVNVHGQYCCAVPNDYSNGYFMWIRSGGVTPFNNYQRPMAGTVRPAWEE